MRERVCERDTVSQSDTDTGFDLLIDCARAGSPPPFIYVCVSRDTEFDGNELWLFLAAQCNTDI